MKALSIKQPWTHAVIYLGKNIENRTWTTNYRGPLLIHASKTFDNEGYVWLIEQALNNVNIPSLLIDDIPHRKDFQMGGIIGMVNLKKMVRSTDYSPWMFGPWGWVLENPKPIDFIPYKGRLGLFDVSNKYHLASVGKLIRRHMNKKYYKWAGVYYCVSYYKNGRIKCAVAVEIKDSTEIRYIKDFSESFLAHCKPISQAEFSKAGHVVISKILGAV